MRDSAIEELVYRVNDCDEIVAIEPGWDEFALSNNSEHMRTDAIVGRPMWDFISDSTTEQIYHDVLKRVRTSKRAISFSFRCDAPECRRFMVMHISRGDDETIVFRSRTVAVEPRPRQALLDPAHEHTETLLRVCGWCKKVDVDGYWVEVEEALSRLGLFESPALPLITHGICNGCHERLLADIA